VERKDSDTVFQHIEVLKLMEQDIEAGVGRLQMIVYRRT